MDVVCTAGCACTAARCMRCHGRAGVLRMHSGMPGVYYNQLIAALRSLNQRCRHADAQCTAAASLPSTGSECHM